MQQSENSGPFQIIPERVEPTLTSYTANNLKPYTLYQFRIQATNDIGPSDWSTESAQVQTLPAGVYQVLVLFLRNKHINILKLKLVVMHIPRDSPPYCLENNYFSMIK